MCWHEWEKWEQYKCSGTVRHAGACQSIPFTEIREKRRCKKCGAMQDRVVRAGSGT